MCYESQSLVVSFSNTKNASILLCLEIKTKVVKIPPMGKWHWGECFAETGFTNSHQGSNGLE